MTASADPHDEPTGERGRLRPLDALLGVALIVATVLVYLPVRDHDFVNYDDNKYVTANPTVQAGLTLEGLRWSLDNRQTANWHPVTWWSHMLDAELYGLDPAGHHLTNVALHALAALLLFLFLRRVSISTWPALWVAAVFALHPLRVESVAWVAERKDVLSGVFWMLALLAYASYVARPSRARHALVSVWLILGLATKPMLVSLPLVLLLLDLWPLRRLSQLGLTRPVREKLPWFAIVAAAALITLFVQSRGGAVRGSEAIDLSTRIANAFAATATYIVKTIWPTGLAVFYPHPAVVHPGESAWSSHAVGAIGLIVVVSALAWHSRERGPGLTTGWGWFLIALLPVVGVVQVGEQAWADRYAYLPTIGLYLAAIAGAHVILGARSALRIPVAIAGAATVVLCAVATRTQLAHWKDSVTLFEHTLAVTERNHIAHFSLGSAVVAAEPARAARHFEAAIEIKPTYTNAYYNLGVTLQRLGRPDEARERFRSAVELSPNHVDARINLGLSLALTGDLEAATPHFEHALELAPENPRLHSSHGTALRVNGELAAARDAYRRVLELGAESSQAHFDLGLSLEGLRELREAAAAYRTALALPNARPVAAQKLAWILAGNTDLFPGAGDEALGWARQLASGGASPGALDLLAAASAAAGDFEAAVRFQTEVLATATGAAEEVTATRRARLAKYEQREALRSDD